MSTSVLARLPNFSAGCVTSYMPLPKQHAERSALLCDFAQGICEIAGGALDPIGRRLQRLNFVW